MTRALPTVRVLSLDAWDLAVVDDRGSQTDPDPAFSQWGPCSSPLCSRMARRPLSVHPLPQLRCEAPCSPQPGSVTAGPLSTAPAMPSPATSSPAPTSRHGDWTSGARSIPAQGPDLDLSTSAPLCLPRSQCTCRRESLLPWTLGPQDDSPLPLTAGPWAPLQSLTTFCRRRCLCEGRSFPASSRWP